MLDTSGAELLVDAHMDGVVSHDCSAFVQFSVKCIREHL